jgi:polysaccharide export outer membrane protein
VLDPHISAGLIETRSQPISVMGAVNTAGTQQLVPGKRLFDAIAGAGGLRTEAGDTIKISRTPQEGKLDLPGETQDPDTGNYVATVRVRDVVELQDSKANIVVRPHDSISVAFASTVYVVGDVRKPGGLILNRRPSISALEALSIAEGLSTTAQPAKARILRPVTPGSTDRQDIPINLKQILAGKTADVQLQPNDVLFVPDNSMRRFVGRMADTALATASGVIIWRGI